MTSPSQADDGSAESRRQIDDALRTAAADKRVEVADFFHRFMPSAS